MTIYTHFVYPPIPLRSWDYTAVTDNYDGEGSPIGYGPTAEAAVQDLIDNIDQDSVEYEEVLDAVRRGMVEER